jgi:hypothetical protein
MDSVVYYQPNIRSARWLLGGEIVDIVSLKALSAQYGPVRNVKTSRDGTHIVRMETPHATFVPIDESKAAAAARRVHSKIKRKIALLAAGGIALTTGVAVSLLTDKGNKPDTTPTLIHNLARTRTVRLGSNSESNIRVKK